MARASLPPELMLSLARPSLEVPRRPCAAPSCCPFLDCLGSRRLRASNGRVSLVLVSQFCTIPRGLRPQGGVGSPSLLHRVVSSRHTGSLAHLGVSEQCIPGGDSWRPVGPPSPRSGPLREPPGLGLSLEVGPGGEGAARVQRPCWEGSSAASLASSPRAEPTPLASSKDARSRGRGCGGLGHARVPASTTPWM